MPKMRALAPEEAATVWQGQYATVDYAEYLAHVKAMRPNESYELTDDGVSPASTRRRYSFAARQSGRKLIWAPFKKTGKLIARLEDTSPERRNGISREPALATSQRSAF